MPSVMFVCLGNICRSPAAEGILFQKALHRNLKALKVASCGIGGWHVGELPDRRMREAAFERGFRLESRAQQFRKDFFFEYDYILAVDREIHESLLEFAEDPEHEDKIRLVCAFSRAFADQDIPDPYYGGATGFQTVLDMLEDACEGILEEVKNREDT